MCAPARMHGSGLRHARAVSWVAALLTVREREWVSERELRAATGWRVPVVWAAHRGQHRPDVGIVVASGARVAVEVELSHKSPRRLAAILGGYGDAIARGDLRGGLIYVSDRADVLDAVRRAAERAGLPERRFRTRELADVQAEVRRLTTAARERANASPDAATADSPDPRHAPVAVAGPVGASGVDERGAWR